jgi:hypothetical protein
LIKEVREYFNARIKECLPTYEDCKDPFGIQDVDRNKLDKAYRVVIGEMSTEDRGNNLVNTIPVRIDLFKKGFNQEQVSFDELFDNALGLRSNILNPRAWNTHPWIRRVSTSTVLNNPLPTNDNNILININFTVLLGEAITTKDL